MSTNCVIARPEGDDFKGRYVHWDGYPSAKVPALLALHAALGYEEMTRILLDEHGAWSVVDPDHQFDEIDECDRYQIVPGVGAAYDDEDFWVNLDTFSYPWLYVLTESGVAVSAYGSRGPEPTGKVAWGEEVTKDTLTRIECGQNLERCGHYASVHFPELSGTDCGRLGTAQYLGRKVIEGRSDASGFVVKPGQRGYAGVPKGVVLQATGSGGIKGWARFLQTGEKRSNIWESLVIYEGEHYTIPTWNTRTDKPVAGVTPVYPDPKNPQSRAS